MKKTYLSLIAALVFLSFSTVGYCISTKELIKTDSAAWSLSSKMVGKKTLAVADFIDLQGNTTEFGKFLAEELSADLQNKSVTVIDRRNLATTMKEMQLSTFGLVDKNSIKELGKITGVDVFVTGTITHLGDLYRVSCRAIETETSNVIWSERWDIERNPVLDKLYSNKVGVYISSPSKSVGGGIQSYNVLQSLVSITGRINSNRGSRDAKIFLSKVTLDTSTIQTKASVLYHCGWSDGRNFKQLTADIYSDINGNFSTSELLNLYEKCKEREN